MKSLFSRLPKKVIAAIAAVSVIAGVAGVVSAWSPNRPTYTIESPAPHVTFNSITNNPNEGDERPFFEVKNATHTGSDGFSNRAEVSGGETLLLRMYVHNNAASNLNTVPDGKGGFKGIATGSKVRVHLPTATDNALRANAYISADNAMPKEVADTVDFVGAKNFSLEYVSGSAVAYTNAVPSGIKLNDSIVTTGAPVGYSAANGIIPGCFQYDMIVTMKVKVKTNDIKVEKSVRKVGETEWKNSMNVNKGDTVEYLIRVENKGTSTLNNVLVGDNLPPYLTYVQNSTKIKNSNYPNGENVPSNNITTGGIDIGAHAAGGVSYVWFRAKVADSFEQGCGLLTLRNVAVAGSEKTGNVQDDAIIKVESGNPCDEPEVPAYKCEMITVTKLGGRKVRVNVDATATNGATVKQYVYDFGDGSDELVTDKDTVEYTYAKDGTYNIRVRVDFTVNGQTKSDVSEDCADTVTFETPETPEEPEVPKELPSTGAGDLIGIFAATTVAGAVAHKFVLSRRYQ